MKRVIEPEEKDMQILSVEEVNSESGILVAVPKTDAVIDSAGVLAKVKMKRGASCKYRWAPISSSFEIEAVAFDDKEEACSWAIKHNMDVYHLEDISEFSELLDSDR